MGRPRQHDQSTATALLEAAERIVEHEGLAALTVRRVANDVGTTTRAIYSSLGSKPVLVAGLGVRAFDLLAGMVDPLPLTDDPAADLVRVGVDGFRAFVLTHPALYRVGIQLTDVPPEAIAAIDAAAERALVTLHRRIRRVQEIGGLGSRSLSDATLEFHATCEGLAGLELRSAIQTTDGQRLWTDTLRSLVAGWGTAPEPGPAHALGDNGRPMPLLN
jgi:AcrR family transcriptional regulator